MNSIELNKTVVTDSRFEQNSAAISDDAFLDGGVQKALQTYLGCCAESWAISAGTSLAVEAQLAPAIEQDAREAAAGNLSTIEKLAEKIRINHGSWAVALLLASTWCLMISAEWCLNQGVLPWLVGAAGIAAFALAGAPSLIPLIFDRILGALFGTEPWLCGTSQPKSRRILLAAIGLLNLVAVGMVGGCRGVVAILRNSRNVAPLTAHQGLLVDSALVMLSIVLALDAAVVFLYFSHEFAAAAAKDRDNNALSEARGSQVRLDTALAQTRRNAARAAQLVLDRDTQISSFKEEFLAERRLLIAARMANIINAKDYKGVVEMREKAQFVRAIEAA